MQFPVVLIRLQYLLRNYMQPLAHLDKNQLDLFHGVNLGVDGQVTLVRPLGQKSSITTRVVVV